MGLSRGNKVLSDFGIMHILFKLNLKTTIKCKIFKLILQDIFALLSFSNCSL